MLIADLYRDIIIPLTKDVEVQYLFHRLGKEPPPSATYFDHCRGPTDAFSDDWMFSMLEKNAIFF